ncbi:MAG: lipase secretion chaperone [Pseudomonadota bacterium]
MKLTIGILGTLLLLVYLTGTPPEQQGPAAPAAALPDPFAFVRPASRQAPANAPPALPIDPALRNLFDYYLALPRDEAERDLAQKFTPAAAVEAKNLLARYVNYATALRALPVQSPRATLLARQQLRLRHFTADQYARLFGIEDANDIDSVKRMEIMQDAQLGSVQKHTLLAALDAALPATLRAERNSTQALVKLEQDIAAMRAAGAGTDDIYRKRALSLSPEAADRLAELEQTPNHGESQ